ncbi:unnamed protein product [Natator depressus]
MSRQSEPSSSQSSQPGPDEVTTGIFVVLHHLNSLHIVHQKWLHQLLVLQNPLRNCMQMGTNYLAHPVMLFNHDRRSAIVDHFASKKHILKEDATQEEGRNQHQKAITSTLKNKRKNMWRFVQHG